MLECRYREIVLMEVDGKVNRMVGTDQRLTDSKVMARNTDFILVTV